MRNRDTYTEPLFFEDIEDALRHVVQSIGGPKVVGAKIRPEMEPEKAGRWLADCLNDARREHLTPQQSMLILRMGREAGMHAAMTYMSRQCGYSDPQPVEPDDEVARMQREFVEATKALGALAARIEDAQSRPIRGMRRVV